MTVQDSGVFGESDRQTETGKQADKDRQNPYESGRCKEARYDG